TARFQIHSTKESGRWVCVEARVKLNTAGLKDGLNQLWIDGRLETERTGLDWRGGYTKHGVNAVFLETYWNQGSPVEQTRWIDNFVISTKPVGPVVCSRNPILIKTEYRGTGDSGGWELELAEDDRNHNAVWKSNLIQKSRCVRVDAESGRFLSNPAPQNKLDPNTIYYARIREQNSAGEWSAWSDWHQPFKTEDAAARVGLWESIGFNSTATPYCE
ncbi:MAG: hypothetical protein ACP5I1_12830, partial [Candidatus Hinthialibacter sp.]